MTQFYIPNTKYEIKTPTGWEKFDGVTATLDTHKKAFKITLDSGKEIIATANHKFLVNGKKIKAKFLKVGKLIDVEGGRQEKIFKIEKTVLKDTYDIHNTSTHTVLAESIGVSNCDELAFVRRSIAKDFWASVFPTLSCLTGDTWVLSDKGYRQIKDYFGPSHKAGDYFLMEGEKTWGKNGIEDISHGYVSPASKTYIVTLVNSQYVEVTENHPLFIWKGAEGAMEPARNLVVGDRVRVDKGMFIEGSVTMSPPTFLEKNDSNLVVMLDDKSLHDLVDYFGEVIHCNSQYELNNFIIALNNYGYDYTVSSNTIRVIRQNKNYRVEWLDIISIEESYQEVTYDFTVPDTHSFLQNGILGSNTGGRCIITSTPSDDEALFAHIWKQAIKKIDEHGNETEVGSNGFSALEIKWNEHPERDASFKDQTIRQIGEEKFRREHELEFIPEDETLIDPIFLAGLAAINPIKKTGEVRWYKELDREKIYLIGYDPSLGTGGDYSAIQIFEFPTMVQVGEWMHNKSDIPTQLKVLKNILDMFQRAGFEEDQVRWTLENNSVGEAPLVLIQEYGEDKFFGWFMSEPFNPNTRGARKSRFRKGYNTNGSTKLTACTRFKRWLENGKMTLNSKALLAELKVFVSKGRTYAASVGEHDDLTMASMLVVRMALETMREEDEYLEELGVESEMDSDDDDDWDAPLPIHF